MEGPTLYAIDHLGVGVDSQSSGPHEETSVNNVQPSQGNDVGNTESNLRQVSFSSGSRRIRCHNFRRGKCFLGSSCEFLHPVDNCKYNLRGQQLPITTTSDKPCFGGTTVELSSQYQVEEANRPYNLRPRSFPGESRKGFLCHYFLIGCCNQGSSCVNLHPDYLNTSTGRSKTPEMVLVNENQRKRKRDPVTVTNVEDNLVVSSTANCISRRKLLILDLNGILVDIVSDYPKRRYKPDTVVSKKGVFRRPYYSDFLGFCFEKFDVGIWSSRRKPNVEGVLDVLLSEEWKKRLVFCWDQSHCARTGYKTIENQKKPLCLKVLQRLWKNGKMRFYNETNTVLLDDSPYKALVNPPYTAVFPFPYSYADEKDNSLGPGGDLRIYLERLAEAEDVQKFIQKNPFGQSSITEASVSWPFYSKILEKRRASQCPNPNSNSNSNPTESKTKKNSKRLLRRLAFSRNINLGKKKNKAPRLLNP